MPNYRYKAVASNGKIFEGDMDAPDQRTVIDYLHHAGHLPLSAEETKAAHTKSIFNIFSHLFARDKIKSRDIQFLTRELSTLLNAGLPLDHALRTLQNISQSLPVKNLVQEIHAKVQGGASLSSALESQGANFSQLYLNMVRAGEAGGALNSIFARLTEYLDRSAELRTTMLSALIYPVILICISLLSVFILLMYVVPQFVPLFEDAGKALPLPTQIVFGVATFLQSYGWLLPVALIFIVWAVDQQLRDPVKRLRWDARALTLPVIGDLLVKLDMARFSRTLGTLLMNGVPLLTTIGIVRDVLVNRVLAKDMDTVIASLEQGRGMAQPLADSRHFPSLAVELIQVGEETGKLEEMMLQIADIYDAESRITTKRLLVLLEPVIIIGLGALIALIIVSILVAILGLNELVV